MSTHRALTPTTGGLFHLPSTRLGRISAVLFLVAVLIMVLVAVLTAVLPAHSLKPGTIGNLNIGPTVIFAIFVAALATGAIALIRDRERSWAVWVSTVFPALVVIPEIVALVTHSGG